MNRTVKLFILGFLAGFSVSALFSFWPMGLLTAAIFFVLGYHLEERS